MTTGEWIVVAIFGVGLLCSLSLLWWLRKLIRHEGMSADASINSGSEALKAVSDEQRHGNG